ncbi:MAG: serine hydrolase [Betaproteobacteria bacterium]|nr:serine hydrolase [Betaproteobacteria bacterium]
MRNLFRSLLPLAPLLFSLPAMAALPTNAEVEAILEKNLIANQRAKGVAVALVDANGIRVVTAGVARDGQPLKADNLFEIGSVTKTFTGLLLAIADEKGEAKLDDPVEKFLPNGLKLRDTAGDPIRMVDIATQRSGLPRLAPNMLPKDPKNPYADYGEADLLDFVKNFRPTRARNAEYEYSNIGFGLLGYALVRAAKVESFEALLSDRILKPLVMANTTSDPKRFADRLAQPHDSNLRPTPAWDLPLAHAGAGAMRATAGDMGRYAEAVAGLKEGALSKAISLAVTTREAGPGRINPIGLAWMSIPFGGRTFMNHDGGTFGSSSSIMVDRATKEGVFIVANTSVRVTDIALHLMDRRHNIAPREFPKQVEVKSETLARYAGVYQLTPEMSITIRVAGNKITAQATRQGEFEIFPESETRFFAKAAPIAITFGEIKDGKAGSFVIEQNGVKRSANRVP